MAENQASEQLPLILTQKSQTERARLQRLSALSAFLHAVALATLLIWGGERLLVHPPAPVITVDLSQIEPSKPRMAPPATPLPPKAPVRMPAPEPVRRPPPAARPAAARPQTPLSARPAPTAPTAVTTPAAATTTPAVAASSTTQGPAVPAAMPARPATGAAPGKSAPAETSAPAAPVVAGAVGGTVKSANTTGIRAGYLQHCRGLIERHKEYPVMARRGGIEGTAVVRGTLSRDGSLRQCSVTRTSGSSLLDNAALRAVRSVGQFPPVPPELLGDTLIFELPVTFRLTAE